VLISHTLKERYRVYDRLGMGGAATVYLARDSQAGQMVIVKVVHPHLVNEQFIGRFEREIDVLQQIDCPYIFRLYDWALREYNSDLDEELSYIVGEFVEGHTLADIIDTRGPLSEPDSLAIARQVALGLVELHKRSIVHRDVKSQNIMITPSSDAKLIDFGIAKGPGHATLTDPSHFAGTLYYAPPEQILESSTVDGRADIYALGVVLYEMLTARLPVRAREFGTIATKIIAGDLDPITGVTPPVEGLVNDMMAHKVEQRIATAQEVIARIEQIVGTAKPEVPGRPLEDTGATMLSAPMPHLEGASERELDHVLVTDDERSLRLKAPETIIGRSHPRDAVRPDVDLHALGMEFARTASRRHCRVFVQDGDFFIEDLGSMNGTRLNGCKLQPGKPCRLADGDEIFAGRVRLHFQPRSHAPDAP
jgi:serine/threonine protein kinase